MASVAHIIRRRRRRKALRREARSRNRTWGWIIGLALGLAIVGPLAVFVGGVASAYARALDALPEPMETVTRPPVSVPTAIYDSTGTTLLFAVEDPLGDRRAWVPLDELPPYLAQATLLMEDPDFLNAPRFNIVSALSKLWDNVLNGPLPPDNSLTGRLVRNTITTSARNPDVDDSALEIALVAEINRQYTPQEVLEWHLNTNYYGNQAYGIEAAAQLYFNKSARDLTLDEAALLTAIPTAVQYNPYDDEGAARTRQSDVLQRLLAAGHITQNQFQGASNTTTAIQPPAGGGPQIASEFAVYARRQTENILTELGYDGAELVARGGLRIDTTLDLDLYYQSECALRAHLTRLAGQSTEGIRTLDDGACIAIDFLPAAALTPGSDSTVQPPSEGTIVIIDPVTGEIRAMVGPGNRAGYQPGPVLQPFIYIGAFGTREFTTASMVLDVPRQFPRSQDGLLYVPNNPDNDFRGPLNLRDAMSMGLLPPVAYIANVQGISNVLREIAHPMGITSLSESAAYNVSLVGSGGLVSVLDVTYAYSVLAAMGEVNGVPVTQIGRNMRTRDPVAVRRILDASGEVLWEYDEEQIALSRAPLLSVELAYLTNDVLADAAPRRITLGPENVLETTRPTAVVNGATSDRIDNWTVGYTPQYVVGVHLGRAEGGPMSLTPFAPEGAAVVWRAILDYAHTRDGLPSASWERPEGVIEATVCEISGMQPNGVCPTRSDIFIEGTQPTQPDTFWQTFELNSENGLLATANTNPALVVERDYFMPPPEAEDWWLANNLALPPTASDNTSRPDILSSATILAPEAYSYVGGQVDVRGSMVTTEMQRYQLMYGEGERPTQWLVIAESETFTPGTSLGLWDTTGLNGLYNLQLRVILNDNTLETSDAILVTVDNTPPSVVLTAGEEGQVFRWPTDTVIPLFAQVQDNYRLDRVVFYRNGLEVGVSDDCFLSDEGCRFDFDIERPGNEVFRVVVYDAVGNSSFTEITVEIVRESG